MTLLEHLRELRSRLFKVVVALLLGSIVGYVVFENVFGFLIAPYCDIPQAFRTDDGNCALVATRALEPFSVRIQVSLLFGAFVSGPVLFYQFWRFVVPGLTPRERRYALPFVVLSQLMFAAGIAFAFVIIPRGLEILLNFGGDDIAPLLTASDYLSFVLATIVAFGVVFELPLVLVLLSLAGVVKSRQLRNFRSYAIVLNFVVAAIITPTTDAVTLLAMVGPMILFYEGSILAAWLIERSRARRATRAAARSDDA